MTQGCSLWKRWSYSAYEPDYGCWYGSVIPFLVDNCWNVINIQTMEGGRGDLPIINFMKCIILIRSLVTTVVEVMINWTDHDVACFNLDMTWQTHTSLQPSNHQKKKLNLKCLRLSIYSDHPWCTETTTTNTVVQHCVSHTFMVFCCSSVEPLFIN